MRIVIALGGNALLRRGESMDAAVHRANVKLAAEAIAAVAEHHEVVLTHGNGPQEHVTFADLRALDLPAGSMGPKDDAVCRFVEHTGGFAAIGALSDAEAILRGEAGTIVVP
jgi:carbamate kinase